MTDPNAKRPGYKETKVGWIPKEWECVPLGEVLNPVKSGTSVKADSRPPKKDELGVLKVSSVTTEKFLPLRAKKVPESETARLKTPVVENSIIVNRANGSQELVGTPALVRSEHPNLYLSDKLWLISVRENAADLYFVFSIVRGSRFRRKVVDLSSGGTGMMNISVKAYVRIPVPLPSVFEQTKIAEILSANDRVIEKTEALIAAKRRQKRALMQQLLAGRRRLAGFGDAWREQRLSSILKESRVPGSTGSEALKLTVKLYGRGVVPKRETQAGSDATQYYRRTAGQFIYSKLDFLNGAFGIVPESLDGYESTLDLPAFDIAPGIHPPWLLAYVTREDFYARWFPLANGGRKARRINPSDFKHIRIPRLSLEEQKSIAAVHAAADREIETLESKLAALRRQKQALMQRLLTGQIRVKVDAA